MNSNDEFWTPGNLMALGAREIVKQHEAEMADLRAELAEARGLYGLNVALSLKAQRDALREELAAAKAERDELAAVSAHAVIDVPLGVPPLEELVKLAADALSRGLKKARNESMVDDAWAEVCAAIRDRVLAGMAPRPVPSREEVADELGKSYYAYFGKEPVIDGRKESRFLVQADAVLALLLASYAARAALEGE